MSWLAMQCSEPMYLGWPHVQDAIVDTTGAGDAFIGSMLYGIVTGLDPKRCLVLAAVVAATKCTAVGARTGLPHTNRICSSLLS